MIVKRMKDFIHKYKDDILVGILAITSCLSLLFGLGCYLFGAMAGDLANVVREKEDEIEQLTIERNMAQLGLDSVIQTYEDVVPKQQYIDDVEYLESVIRDFRCKYENDCIDN